jgi:hypothetical protein
MWCRDCPWCVETAVRATSPQHRERGAAVGMVQQFVQRAPGEGKAVQHFVQQALAVGKVVQQFVQRAPGVGKAVQQLVQRAPGVRGQVISRVVCAADCELRVCTNEFICGASYLSNTIAPRSSRGRGVPSNTIAPRSSRGRGVPSNMITPRSSRGRGVPSNTIAPRSCRGRGVLSNTIAPRSSRGRGVLSNMQPGQAVCGAVIARAQRSNAGRGTREGDGVAHLRAPSAQPDRQQVTQNLQQLSLRWGANEARANTHGW